MLLRVFVVVAVLVLASLSAFAGDLSTDEISSLQEKAKKDAAGMVLPPNDYEALGRQKAEEAYRIYQSEEFQKKIALERERIQKEVFGREGPTTRTAKRAAPREGSGPTSGSTSFSPHRYPRRPFAATRARRAPWETAT